MKNNANIMFLKVVLLKAHCEGRNRQSNNADGKKK